MKKGDLIYLPANARIWFRDGESWVFWETQSPSSAVFLEQDENNEAAQLLLHPNPIKMYWDNKFCWANKEDVYLARKNKEAFL